MGKTVNLVKQKLLSIESAAGSAANPLAGLYAVLKRMTEALIVTAKEVDRMQPGDVEAQLARLWTQVNKTRELEAEVRRLDKELTEVACDLAYERKLFDHFKENLSTGRVTSWSPDGSIATDTSLYAYRSPEWAKVAAERGFRIAYAGVWRDGHAYERGQFVTHRGSLWHCNSDTQTCPGSDISAEAWTLAVKQGKA